VCTTFFFLFSPKQINHRCQFKEKPDAVDINLPPEPYRALARLTGPRPGYPGRIDHILSRAPVAMTEA
jgi:hypothetical protein